MFNGYFGKTILASGEAMVASGDFSRSERLWRAHLTPTLQRPVRAAELSSHSRCTDGCVRGSLCKFLAATAGEETLNTDG